MASSFSPNPGNIGLPSNSKEGGSRVDFRANKALESSFDFLVSTKCPRYVWGRAIQCPCIGVHNDNETEQPNINCKNCNQLGWSYFLPKDYEAPEAIGDLTKEQEEVIACSEGVVIRALVTSATSQPDIYAVLGQFSLGSATCTVRPKNALGYYDRLVGIDETMVFSEVIKADGSDTVGTHYPVVSVNAIMYLDADENKQYYGDDDFLLEAGVIKWNTGKAPAADTQFTIHYLCHPVWVVSELDKISRTSLVKQKRSNTQTPQGDILHLPMRVVVRLSHLPLKPGAQ